MVFRYKGYRFFFFSREETRIHVHVYSADGEAKFWIEPGVALAHNYGFSSHEVRVLQRIVEEKVDDIRDHWRKHFTR